MSKIKTRDSTPGIKTIDRANVIGERMRKGLIRTKEKTMDLIDDGQVTADEYAADQVQSGVEEVIADTGHSVVTAPKHVYDHIHGTVITTLVMVAVLHGNTNIVRRPLGI